MNTGYYVVFICYDGLYECFKEEVYEISNEKIIGAPKNALAYAIYKKKEESTILELKGRVVFLGTKVVSTENNHEHYAKKEIDTSEEPAEILIKVTSNDEVCEVPEENYHNYKTPNFIWNYERALQVVLSREIKSQYKE